MSIASRLSLGLLSGGLYALVGRQAVALGTADVGPLPRFLFGAGLVLVVTALVDWRPAPRGWLVAGVVAALLSSALLLLPERLTGAVLATAGEPLPPAAGRLLAALLAWSGVVVSTVAVSAALLWRSPPLGWRLPIALFGLYGALLASGSQLQSLTGDEPHYLLAARSLVVDQDIDLTEDYAAGRYREFYPSDLIRRSLGRAPLLDPHDVPGPRGERLPIHQLGLSLLVAPGYALSGRHGALLVALLFGTLAGWQAIRLAEARAPESGRFGGFAVALLSPLLAFSGSLHAEPAATAAIAWLAILATAETVTARQRIGAALALGGLAWLHLKLLPVAILLAGYLTVDGLRRGERRAWLPALGLAAGTLAQLALFAWRYGSWSPSAPQLLAGGKYPVPFGGSPLIGLPGLWFDQQDGLAVVWPLVLLALPGLLLTWRAGWARRLAAVIALHLLLIATYELWRSGFAPAGRQLLPIVPLLGPFVAVGAGWLRARRGWLLSALLAINAGVVLVGAWLPRLRYPIYQAGAAQQPLVARLGSLGELLPLVGSSGLATATAWVYLGVWLALSAAAVGRKGSQA